MNLSAVASKDPVPSVALSSNQIALLPNVTLERFMKACGKSGVAIDTSARSALVRLRNKGLLSPSKRSFMRFNMEQVLAPEELRELQRSLQYKYLGAVRAFEPNEVLNTLYQAVLNEALHTLHGNFFFWSSEATSVLCPGAIFGLSKTDQGITLGLHRPHFVYGVPCYIAFSMDDNVTVFLRKRSTT